MTRRSRAKAKPAPKTSADLVAAGIAAAVSIVRVDMDALLRCFEAEVLPIARRLGVVSESEGVARLSMVLDGPDAPVESPERAWKERARFHVTATARMLHVAGMVAPGLAIPEQAIAAQVLFIRGYLMGASDRGASGTVAANAKAAEHSDAKRNEIREAAKKYAEDGRAKSYAARRLCIREFPGVSQGTIANILSEEFPGGIWKALSRENTGTGHDQK